MGKSITTEEFIEKARKVHGDKYEYSKVNYVNTATKVCFTCHEKDENGVEHGEFWQTPNAHLQGSGCQKCGRMNTINAKTKSSTDFLEKAKEVHNNKYDYSKMVYINKDTKICIVCHEKDKNGVEHGEFWQKPEKHLYGQGCPICRYVKSAKSKSNSIDKFKKDLEKLDTSIEVDESTYVNYKTKMKFICHKKDKEGNEHGEFWMSPNNIFHKNNPQGCPKCGRERTIAAKTYSLEKFIELANKKHNNKFSYDKTNLTNKDEKGKVCITCPIHGDFWQLPNNHLYGQGCPICKESTLERICKTFLMDNDISFVEQYNTNWLGRLSLDFFLPDYKIGIECQGKQHFGMGNWNMDIETIFERDKRKLSLCNENGIKLLYYSNLGIEYPYHVYEDLDELLTKIKEND